MQQPTVSIFVVGAVSAYWDDIKTFCDITDEDIQQNLKFVATELNWFCTQGIPVDDFDTNSLRSFGVMALDLSGYSDTQIHKMGRWMGALFK